MIPHYEQKWLQLLDKEDEEGVVEDNFEDFQKTYRKVLDSKYNDIISIKDGFYEIE